MSDPLSQQSFNPSSTPRTVAIIRLQEIYGKPSQAGFGSAVFCDRVTSPAELERAALKYYRYFLGSHWDEFGEAAWMTDWKRIYQRSTTTHSNILEELHNISDPGFQRSFDVFLTGISTPEAGQQALSAVYNDPAMADLAVYTLGDGDAMSGILLTGRYNDDTTVLLVFLLD